MDVERKELKNGLVVATEVMSHIRSVSIGVWVKSGSRIENERSIGISHFIEHLLFKGTRSRSAADIAEATDSVGGQLNAFTDKEFVGFYAKVLDEHLPFAFELLSDIVCNPTFPAAEIERERNVIFEEISMVEDSPQDLVYEIFLEKFWRKHPLGRPISGTKKSVAQITRSDVRRFFRKNYTGSNIVVSVAGNIQHRQVQRLARRHFGDLDTGAVVALGASPGMSSGKTVRRKARLEQTHLCLGVPCPPLVSDDRFTVLLLSQVLGGGLSSRLFQKIREERGLVYAIHASLILYRDAGALVVYAGSSASNVEEVIDRILREIRKLRERLIPPEELKRAKENIKGSIMLGLESSSSRMSHLAQQEIHFGKFSRLEDILGNVDRIRAKDLRRLANEICNPELLTLAALGDCKGVQFDAGLLGKP